MKERIKTLVLSVLALFLGGGGVSTLLSAPFYPIFSDRPPASWLGIPILLLLGMASTALSVWLWILAWRHWYRE